MVAALASGLGVMSLASHRLKFTAVSEAVAEQNKEANATAPQEKPALQEEHDRRQQALLQQQAVNR